MALDAHHRSSIYGKFVPLLGQEDANALMTAFPSLEADELITKQFLRAEMQSLRVELAEFENRITVRAGTALGAVTAILAALISLQ